MNTVVGTGVTEDDSLEWKSLLSKWVYVLWKSQKTPHYTDSESVTCVTHVFINKNYKSDKAARRLAAACNI